MIDMDQISGRNIYFVYYDNRMNRYDNIVLNFIFDLVSIFY